MGTDDFRVPGTSEHPSTAFTGGSYMRLTLHTFLTLDGVMQAPGEPEEDPEGGFEHGGWSFPYADQDFGAAMSSWFGQVDAFLLGRKTYQNLQRLLAKSDRRQ